MSGVARWRDRERGRASSARGERIRRALGGRAAPGSGMQDHGQDRDLLLYLSTAYNVHIMCAAQMADAAGRCLPCCRAEVRAGAASPATCVPRTSRRGSSLTYTPDLSESRCAQPFSRSLAFASAKRPNHWAKKGLAGADAPPLARAEGEQAPLPPAFGSETLSVTPPSSTSPEGSDEALPFLERVRRQKTNILIFVPND